MRYCLRSGEQASDGFCAQVMMVLIVDDEVPCSAAGGAEESVTAASKSFISYCTSLTIHRKRLE